MKPEGKEMKKNHADTDPEARTNREKEGKVQERARKRTRVVRKGLPRC